MVMSPIRDSDIQIKVYFNQIGNAIDRNIYGQFIEHLWTCIYDGIWVGPDSSIPNEDGIRLDTVEALAAIMPPIVRWPGGAYADMFDWRDSIGPRHLRPVRTNPNQPKREETNQFGLSEFMRFCHMIGASPYLCVNTAFLRPSEVRDWVEYCNLNGNTYWAKLRRQHGQEHPYKVHYWGIGNESYWLHSAHEYLQRYRLWKMFMKDTDPTIEIISSGLEPNWHPDPWGRDDWGTYFIKEIRGDMDQYSIHLYFTVGDGANFSDVEYYRLFVELFHRLPRSIRATLGLLDAHSTSPKKVKLAIDEWGIWHPGHPMSGNMTQPCTLRDALFVAAFFHICHQYPTRIGIATIAQSINVCSSLILTNREKFCLTPTYHVFDMFKEHQGAQILNVVTTNVETITSDQAGMHEDGEAMPPMLSISATLSKDKKKATISFINFHLVNSISAKLDLKGARPMKGISKILTASTVKDQNTFDSPNHVKIVAKPINITGTSIECKFPPHSITVMTFLL